MKMEHILLKAKAYDISGLSSESQIQITIQKLTLPTIKIIKPLNNSLIPPCKTTIQTQATNTNSVDFYINGNKKDTDSTPPFTFSFNAGNYIGKKLAIKAVAKSSIYKTEDTIYLTVSNNLVCAL